MQILRVCHKRADTIKTLISVALQAADGKAFQNCNWYDLATSADCLNKPGFNAVWGELNKFHVEFDKNLDWVDVISDMAPLSTPLQPDVSRSHCSFSFRTKCVS